MEQTDLRYLKSLAKQYPTVAAAATEIINLQAILSLPKGTEHFITDIHGEYDQFQHVLKNGFRGDQEKDRGRVRECHQSGRKEIDRHTDLLPGTKDGAGDKDRGEHGGLVQGHIVPPDKDLQRSVF